jgi:flagellar assembly factor FliW
MELMTKRFGTIEVPDENALEVPAGIPGFPQMRRATLMGASAVTGATTASRAEGAAVTDATETPLFWLQDLDDGDLAFLCVVPWMPFPEYDFDIDGDDLGIEDDGDVRILNIITVRRGDQDASMTANLRAPLVVDVRNQRLHQVILTDARWPINAPIAALESAEVH